MLLERLAEANYPTIHLEKMAGHRGSIFGQIGMHPNNQKQFDSLLVESLIKYKEASFVFIEGESNALER